MKFIWLIAGIVLLGLVLGRWATRELNSHAPNPLSQTASQRSATNTQLLSSDTAPLLSQPDSGRPNFRLGRLRHRDALADPTNTWEEEIEAILNSEENDAVKGRQLLALFSELPTEGQAEVAELLGDMLSDEAYPALVPYLTNSATAEPVLDVLVDGLLVRPDTIRLPLLLIIARDEQHPNREEALDFLEGFLGQNYGTNWDEWSTNVDLRLSPPPGEEEMAPQTQ